MLPIIRGALALNRANNIRKSLSGGRGSGRDGGGTQNLVGRGTRNQTNAMVVRPKTSLVSRSNITGNFSSGSGSSSLKSKSNDLEGNVKSIKVTVISIDKIIKSNFVLEKQAEKDAIKREELLARKNRESDLESKKKPIDLTKSKDRKVRIPGQGLFGGILDFFVNMFLGWASLKLLKHLPTLTKILKPLVSAVDFFIDFAGKILNGLVTFIDWGVKLYDFSRQGVSKLFGETGLKVFDGFINALTTVTNLAILAMMAGINPLDPFGRGKPKGGPQSKPRRGRPGVTQGRGSRGPGFRIPGTGPRITQGRGTQGPKTRIPGTGPRVTQGRGGKPKFPKLPRIRTPRALKGAGLVGLLLLIPTLFEVGGLMAEGYWKTGLNVAVSTLAGIAAASAATGTVVAGGLAAGLTGIGIPAGVAAILSSLVIGGIAGWAAYEASYNGLKALGLRDDDPELKAQGYSRGGSVGKTDKRNKDISYTEPRYKGIELDEKDKEFYGGVRYKTEGGVTTKVDVPEEQQKASKHIKSSMTEYGSTEFVGPLFNLYSKSLIGKKPTESDYKAAGQGFNAWVANALNSGDLSVKDILSRKDFDLSTWSSSSLRDLIGKSSRKLSSSYKSGSYGSYTPGSTGFAVGERDSATGMLTSLGSGGGSLKDMTDQDFSDLAFIVSAEAARGTDDEYGVAAAVLNRVADPRFPNTIMGVGTAPGQFEAVYKGYARRDEALAKKLKDNQGKIVEALKELQGRTDFKGQSELENMGDSDIMFDPKGNFFHYLEQVGKTDPVPSNIPQDWKKLLGPSAQKRGGFFGSPFGTSENIEEGKGGEAAQRLLADFPQIKTRGNDSQIFASGLGYWLKKNFVPTSKDSHRIGKGDLGDPNGGDMEHPDHGGIVASHRGEGHYLGKALDLGAHGAGMGGAYTGDQKYLWPYVAKFLKIYGLNKEPFVPQVIHATGESFGPRKMDTIGPDAGHNDHFHIEFHKGGFVPGSSGTELMARVLSKEFVTDVDSSQALEQAYPGLLLAVNKASSKEGVIKAVSEYTSVNSPQLIIQREQVTNTVYASQPSSSMPQNSSSTNNMDYFGVLDRLPG